MNAVGISLMKNNVGNSKGVIAAERPTSDVFKNTLNKFTLKDSQVSNSVTVTKEDTPQIEDMNSTLNALSSLFENVSMEDGYLNKNMLNHDRAKELLAQLPEQDLISLEMLFASNISIEDLLTKVDLTKEQDLASILTVLADLEGKGYFTSNDLDNLLQTLTPNVEQGFNINMGKNYKSIHEFLIGISQSLQGNQKSVSTISVNQSLNLMIGKNDKINKQDLMKQLESLLNVKITEQDLTAFSTKIGEVIQSELEGKKGFNSLIAVLSLLDKNKKSNEHIYNKITKEIVDQIQLKANNTINKEAFSSLIEKLISTTKANSVDSGKENILAKMLDSVQTSNVDKQPLINGLKEQAPLSKVEHYVLHVSQSSNGHSTNSEFIKQFQNIMKQSFVNQQGLNGKQLVINLRPEHLGSLTVKISQIQGEMVARIIASSTSAKDLIESNLHQLRNVFSTQNMNIEKVEVTLQQNSQNEQSSQDKEQKKRDENDANNEKNSREDNDSSNPPSFAEELLNLTI